MTSYRLASGGALERTAALNFSFDGRMMTGFAGDTLASALLANGRMLVGRGFKYHRPRGILTAGSAEPNALVTVGRGGRQEPNTRATVQELYEGLEAVSQNRWPSLERDIGAVNGLLSPFLGAGFYYKTFMWPKGFWEKVYEPFIRRAAGLGKATHEADPDVYDKSWAHCDLLVIGAGPAGLAAALSAARAGARVLIADEGPALGGSLLADTARVGGAPGPVFARGVAAELAALSNVRVLTRTVVFGWYDSNVFGAVERVQKHVAAPDPHVPVERLWRIVAKAAILATGAEERPLVFGGNDRPGVMMAGAMRAYLNRWAVAPGRRVGVFTNTDAGYALATDLEAAGVEVAAIVDPRPARAEWLGRARVIRGVVAGTHGRQAVSAMTVRRDTGEERVEVDALAMSGGFSPVISLACHRGGRAVWSAERAAFLAPEVDGLSPVGAAAGADGLAACLADGARAAERLGYAAAAFGAVEGAGGSGQGAPIWAVSAPKGKAFVDFQNDVHLKDVKLAHAEGYGHVELAKRYTTNGMATDQGKLGNVNAIGLLAEARGVSPAEVGTTTFRPFYTPVSFGALTGTHRGRHFQPVRRSALHGWAEKHGARFVETGLWLRSSYFPRPGETHWRESVDREARAVRSGVGICDVSMLGKIEIFGSDAAEFLNRVYCNAFLKLPVGRARYGLMLREDGCIYDDGTTSRLGEQHYFMTTTTALAAGVLTHLEFCAQALWPEFDVRLASATDQWAQMAVAGPKAREVLAQIVEDDLSDAAFPYLAAREVTLKGGLTGRLFRISFSGELAYELAVPAGYGEAVADAVLAAGAAFGITPYGSETLGVLRVEKGHVTHAEINGTVTPGDLGFGKMVSATKPDFIGKAMLGREGMQDPARPALVGVRPLDPATGFKAGAHILRKGDAATLENDQGYVSSAIYSPHVGSTIGLALVTRGPERHGEEVLVWDAVRDAMTPAVLCAPCFVDPENERLHV
ncbi:MAG: sarcosine oxidase subunit alpha family protein [Amaricoccus sp.]|uniref:sarcosine oxidase subunit alpha family protein n=1 Tax=Amaricoccus sp. TaxID=1872485 RepID=UPI0039E50B9B